MLALTSWLCDLWGDSAHLALMACLLFSFICWGCPLSTVRSCCAMVCYQALGPFRLTCRSSAIVLVGRLPTLHPPLMYPQASEWRHLLPPACALPEGLLIAIIHSVHYRGIRQSRPIFHPASRRAFGLSFLISFCSQLGCSLVGSLWVRWLTAHTWYSLSHRPPVFPDCPPVFPGCQMHFHSSHWFPSIVISIYRWCFLLDISACRTSSSAPLGQLQGHQLVPPFTDVSPPIQYISRWGGQWLVGTSPRHPLQLPSLGYRAPIHVPPP